MDENLMKMESFFQEDINIKKELYNAAITEQDTYDEESIIKYSDKLFKLLKYLESAIIKMLNDYEFDNSLINSVKNKFIFYNNKLADCKTDPVKLKQFYNNCLSYMSSEFVEATKSTCIGYYIFRTPGPVLEKANTVNEILHLIHFYIMNNEEIYQSLPIIKSKPTNDYNNITLYGKESQVATDIYNVIDKNFPSDIMDIVGLSDGKIIILARNLGHALSVEITKEKDNYKVEYFIPKVCNMEMVNELPGVNRVTEESRNATGMFIISEESFVNNLIQFMKRIPTDADMNLER